MSIDLDQYYDRFDAADRYERHLFVAGNVLQSAELNELQSAAINREQRVADSLFPDGTILSGATLAVNPSTGAATITSGTLYLRGAVRTVAGASLTLATSGTVAVGVYLTETVVTWDDDADLLDPAVSADNYNDPGAARLRVTASWGFSGDGHSGTFYPVYSVVDGVAAVRRNTVKLGIPAYLADGTSAPIAMIPVTL